jgi:hypothetical protein
MSGLLKGIAKVTVVAGTAAGATYWATRHRSQEPGAEPVPRAPAPAARVAPAAVDAPVADAPAATADPAGPAV